MDDLSIKLNQSGIGGVIGGHLINHLCYADDLCLISLFSAGMQKLSMHLLTYNGSKSYSLSFKPKHIKLYAPCFSLNKLEIPKVDQCKYLGIMISIKNCDIDMKRQIVKFYRIFQRRARFLIPEIKNHSYPERLQKLGLPTLAYIDAPGGK